MEKEKQSVASENEVLETLARILRREETEDNAIKVKDGEGGEHIELIKLRPKISDVIKAAELNGKAHGIFSERVSGSITLPLVICGEDEL